ncbi:MAG: regulatory protein RecX [Spirochaetes bacterium]|nr:regulatory protein RecX [Spirochaetota bacterium]
MLISDIVQQKRNKKYFSIYVDGHFQFSLSQSDLDFLDLKKGDSISREKLDALIKEYALQKARDYAFTLLSKKSYSKKQFTEKLENKKYPPKIIRTVIEELEKSNYINDQEFIYQYTRDKIQQKPMGRFRLKNELWQKKFDEPLIKECVEKVYEEIDERQLARQALKSRFKKIPQKMTREILNKINNFLLARGFSYEIIYDIIDDLKKDNENKD